MEYKIKEGAYPTVEVILNNGENIIANSRALCWRDTTFQMETIRNENNSLFVGLLSKNHFFMNRFTAGSSNSKITFGSSFPGSIKAVELKEGESIICKNGSLLFASGNVNISVFFNKKVGVGIFGGEAFILEKITGPGFVFIEIDGDEIEYSLESNQKMIISEGHLVSVSEGCTIDVESNKGFTNVLFSGEGLFTTSVMGPGKVTLQSMPIEKLADKVNPYISHPESNNK